MQELKVSQYLRHEKYGLGVVSTSNGQRTTIDFYDHGMKKFATELLVVELLPGRAPERAILRTKAARKAPQSKVSSSS